MALGGSAPRRYAEALFDLASAANAVPRFRDALERLAAAFDADVLRALRDPGQPVGQRVAAVEAAAKDEPAEVRALLALLVRRDRIAIFPVIARAFGALVDRRAGIAEARVTTAVALEQTQESEMVSRLERTSGIRIRASFFVDPTILGGAKVQIGDRLIDGSVRAQLELLGAQLAS